MNQKNLLIIGENDYLGVIKYDVPLHRSTNAVGLALVDLNR